MSEILEASFRRLPLPNVSLLFHGWSHFTTLTIQALCGFCLCRATGCGDGSDALLCRAKAGLTPIGLSV